ICDAEPAASVHPCYSLAKHSQRVRAEPPGLHQTNGGTYRLRTEPTALMAGHRPRQEAQQTKVIVAGALVLLEPPQRRFRIAQRRSQNIPALRVERHALEPHAAVQVR